jgi:hypothetical protein
VRCDNKIPLLWRHTTGVASLWQLSPLGLFESGNEFGPFAGWEALAGQ